MHDAGLGCKKSKQYDSCQQQPEIFIYVASSESGFKSLSWKFKLSLEVSAEKSFSHVVMEQPTCSHKLRRGRVCTGGPAAGFFSASTLCVWGGGRADGTLRYNRDLC